VGQDGDGGGARGVGMRGGGVGLVEKGDIEVQHGA
jgi:hypothetical protein